MSEVRLDVATLRWVCDWLREWGTVYPSSAEWIQHRARAFMIARDSFERIAREVEAKPDLVADPVDVEEVRARPPLLSDWVRACEVSKAWAVSPPSFGTAAGHPRWSGYRSVSVVLFRGDVWVDIRTDGGACVISDTRKPQGEHETSCATPAELTAALDRLAEGASRG